jgi:hypothetical protein
MRSRRPTSGICGAPLPSDEAERREGQVARVALLQEEIDAFVFEANSKRPFYDPAVFESLKPMFEAVEALDHTRSAVDRRFTFRLIRNESSCFDSS